MTFDDWMRARNPKYCPTDDTVALRALRDCWRAAEYHSERAQEREMMIELMRDKCRKVGAGETVKPVAWVRFCSDGCYEGPTMDEQIEDVRKNSGHGLHCTRGITLRMRGRARPHRARSRSMRLLEG